MQKMNNVDQMLKECGCKSMTITQQLHIKKNIYNVFLFTHSFPHGAACLQDSD